MSVDRVGQSRRPAIINCRTGPVRSFVNSLVLALRGANRRRVQQRRTRRGGDYRRWVLRHDTLTPRVSAALHARLAALHSPPTIALVMLTRGADRKRLIASIESVKAQIYPQWELHIALDPYASPSLLRQLAADAARDERIRLVPPDANAGGGTSAVLDAALTQVSAPSVGILGGSEVLAQHALLLVAEAMARHPHADVFYSDEDELDSQGQRCNPHFKCDWNPELLLCSPYLRHLTIYRTTLVRGRGTLGPASADDIELLYQQLALRCTESIGASGVVHIPHILCHSHAGTATTGQGGAVAVRDRLQRIGLDARVDIDPLGGYRLSFAPPSPPPLVSIVIPTRDRLDLLRPCVDSVLVRTRYAHFEIIVVDNGSEEPQTLRYLEQLAVDDRVRVLRDERPFNYAALNNRAVDQARGEFIVLLNNDTEVISANWLGDMLGLAALPGIGAVGARLWYDDMSLQHAGVILGLGGVAGHAHRALEAGMTGYRGRAHLLQAVSAVTAACLLVRKCHYLAVGGLDEKAFAVAYNDVDFCLRLRAAGFRNVWTPNAELFHHESKSRGSDLSDEHIVRYRGEVAAMLERWGPVLKHDPAYNPNLSLDDETFGLAWPPRVSLLTPWFDEPAAAHSPLPARHETTAVAPSQWRAAASMASPP
jgi:GT2 family glycosyltransferase